MSRETPWTPAEREKLRELWDAQELTASQIGQVMGRSKNSIAGEAARLRAKGLLSSDPRKRATDLSPEARQRRAEAREKTLARLAAKKVRAEIPEAPLPISVADAAPVVVAPEVDGADVATALPPPLKNNECRWPLWSTGSRPTHEYCRKPVATRVDGKRLIYCEECYRKAVANHAYWLPKEDAA